MRTFAKHATPSFLPMNPNLSVVVAFKEISSSFIFRYLERFLTILFLELLILGISPM